MSFKKPYTLRLIATEIKKNRSRALSNNFSGKEARSQISLGITILRNSKLLKSLAIYYIKFPLIKITKFDPVIAYDVRNNNLFIYIATPHLHNRHSFANVFYIRYQGCTSKNNNKYFIYATANYFYKNHIILLIKNYTIESN